MTTQFIPQSGRMSRRQLLTVVAALPLVAIGLAACGDDTVPDRAGSPGSPAPTTAPGTGTDGAIAHPMGAGDVILRIETGVGGFTTANHSFAQLPELLITGDGQLIRPGPQLAIYPGPLLPALQSVPVSPEEIQEVLRLAQSFELFSNTDDQTLADRIADAGSTVVTIGAEGQTFVHRVFALGFDGEFSGDPAPGAETRRRIADFVDAVSGLDLGTASEPVLYEPDQWVIGWLEADPANGAGDIEPIILPWPSDFADPIGDCVTVDRALVRQELAGAKESTFFRFADGRTVQPLVRPLLPGSTPCPT